MNKQSPRWWLLSSTALALQWSADRLQCGWLEPLALLVVVLPWLSDDIRTVVGVAIGAGLLREMLSWAPLGFYVGPYLLMALALWRVARAIPHHHWPLRWAGSLGALFAMRFLQHLLRAV